MIALQSIPRSVAVGTGLVRPLATRGSDKSVAPNSNPATIGDAAGSADRSFESPPATGLSAHLSFGTERVCRAIFGSPVVRADAAGLARTNPRPRLRNLSRALVIGGEHPPRRGWGFRACGICNSFSFLNRAGVQHLQKSGRRLSVSFVRPFVFAAFAHGNHHAAEEHPKSWKLHPQTRRAGKCLT